MTAVADRQQARDAIRPGRSNRRRARHLTRVDGHVPEAAVRSILGGDPSLRLERRIDRLRRERKRRAKRVAGVLKTCRSIRSPTGRARRANGPRLTRPRFASQRAVLPSISVNRNATGRSARVVRQRYRGGGHGALHALRLRSLARYAQMTTRWQKMPADISSLGSIDRVLGFLYTGITIQHFDASHQCIDPIVGPEPSNFS